MGITEIWTIIAIVLKLCGVGAFASWDIIAMPWHWSCLCIEMWSLILYALILVLIRLKLKQRKEVDMPCGTKKPTKKTKPTKKK